MFAGYGHAGGMDDMRIYAALPLKKLEPNPEDLLKLLHGWRDEAIKAGRPITRIAVAYETGRDSF
jgi:hypothetical protein